MGVQKSKLYENDIEDVVRELKCLDKLSGKSVMITGASGLICSCIVDILLKNNELNNADTRIFAAGRSKDKIMARFSDWDAHNSINFVQYDASGKNVLELRPDYIIHGASNAHPAAVQKYPVETMLDNFNGVYELLQLAKESGSTKLLYISSSEVYGTKSNSEPFTEDEYGSVNLLNPRSSYASGKRAAETLCASFDGEYGTKSVIVRPGHIYGPTASRADNRVSSEFAYKAAQKENLVLKSDGRQLRSYCYVLDAASAILTVLIKGEAGEAYNISNKTSLISIRQMAELFAKFGGVRLQFDMPTDREKAAFNPMDNSTLKSEKLESLGWTGAYTADIGIEHTVKIIREMESL